MYLGEAAKQAGSNGKIYRKGSELAGFRWKGPAGFTTEDILADDWEVAEPRYDLLTAIEVAMSQGRGVRLCLGTPGHHIVIHSDEMESCEWEIIWHE